MLHSPSRSLTSSRMSAGTRASCAARLPGASRRSGSKYQRSSVARSRNSRSLGSNASYSLTLVRMRSRICGGRLVKKVSRSSGVMASNWRNKSTGDCGRDGPLFVDPENNFTGGGAPGTVPANIWKIIHSPATQNTSHQRACHERFIAGVRAIPHRRAAGSCAGWR